MIHSVWSDSYTRIRQEVFCRSRPTSLKLEYSSERSQQHAVMMLTAHIGIDIQRHHQQTEGERRHQRQYLSVSIDV